MYRPRFHSVADKDRLKILLTIDGETVNAEEGDTLLTVLMRHDGWVRDSEFGDGQRAGFCAMGVCQDCWLTLQNGERHRACTTVASAGMAIVRNPAPHA